MRQAHVTEDDIYLYYNRDHLGNIRVVMGQTGELEQVNHYYAYGGLMRESTNPGVQPYKYGGKELDRTSGLDAYDFGARMYFADRMQWGQVDPMCEKYYDVSPYGYCLDNPVMFIDPNGCKDTVFVKGKDKPVSEDPNTRTPLYYPDGSPNSGAYNCHMYAWSYPDGDPSDIVNPLFPKWDEHPENNMLGYTQLNTNEPNEVDDRLIYYIDENSDGKYQKGEQIVHSAIVFQVDKEGYTTEVISKMGQGGISRNHPRAPGFYEEHNGQKTSRAYYRETKKWILHSNRHSSSSPKYHHVERPDALYVAPKIH